jgi:acyl-coenzyme A synthetase/AMP-(fatty) acid ligase
LSHFFYKTLVDRWWKKDRLLFNSYGPTETTVSATAILLHPGEPISIGVPLPNYVCCLLDETTGQPTSANTGELCIRGPGVALGYVGRESLTREKFTKYGYRTGDRVTFDNGKIFFHERIDSQVKLRGFRIELDEIEQELLRLGDEVQSAAVAVLHEQLVAFIVGNLTESHMRETLAQRLPHYMVPDRLIKLNGAMPRLVSGKINRKALAALFSKEDADKMAASEAIIDMGKFTRAIFL